MTQIVIKNEKDLKLVLVGEYQKQIQNYFGDEKKALEFLSGVMAAVQRTPKLIDCNPVSIINSFMMMAQLKLMPSGVSGEAYVLPYNSSKGMEAQFQLGYQGLVTLFYRAGVKSIIAEIVKEKDTFEVLNNQIVHKYDPFSDDRGKARGAYTIIELQSGGIIQKVMSAKEILAMGAKFSKSYKSDYSPWNEANDPNLWMWKKTVLKQAAKLVPKNETIFKAIDADNQDSVISDRLEKAKAESSSLKMGNLVKNGPEKNQKAESEVGEKDTESVVDAESNKAR